MYISAEERMMYKVMKALYDSSVKKYISEIIKD